MDVEFLVQDAFSTLRPQFKIAKTLEEAGNAFAEACKENYKIADPEKATAQAEAEAAEPDGSVDGDDELEERGRKTPDADDADSSSDEAEVSPRSHLIVKAHELDRRKQMTSSLPLLTITPLIPTLATKTSLLRVLPISTILKPTQNLIVNLPSSCPKALKRVKRSGAQCLTLHCRCAKHSAIALWQKVKMDKRQHRTPLSLRC